MHVLIATSWLDPFVNFLAWVVLEIHHVIPNLGLCLIVLAALIRGVFWPLNTKQFKSMMAMQKIAPQLKALQAKYAKTDQQRYQQETMALYKTAGANPLAGCWPMLVQYPIIISVYYMVILHKDLYAQTSFAWVGTSLATLLQHQFPKFPAVMATSLAQPDLLLVVLYAISMYVSMRYTTMTSADPSQAQQMKIMQIISPLMIGFIGVRYNWPSAVVLYWLAYNVFTMGQQLYLLRKFHQPLSLIDSEHAVTESVTAGAATPKQLPGSSNGAVKNGSKKKNKKGAKK